MPKYIELVVFCELKSTTPYYVIELLQYLTRKKSSDYDYDIIDYDIPIIDELNYYGAYFFDVESGCYQDWRDIFQPPNRTKSFQHFQGEGYCRFKTKKGKIKKHNLNVRCEIDSPEFFANRHIPFLMLLAHYIKQTTKETYIGYIRTSEGKMSAIFVEADKLLFSENISPKFKIGIDNIKLFI